MLVECPKGHEFVIAGQPRLKDSFKCPWCGVFWVKEQIKVLMMGSNHRIKGFIYPKKESNGYGSQPHNRIR